VVQKFGVKNIAVKNPRFATRFATQFAGQISHAHIFSKFQKINQTKMQHL